MSFARGGSVLTAILCLLTFPACRREPGSFPVGSYRTVSESEWDIILTLKNGGTADIRVESWAPGEYKNRSSHKTGGRWRLEGNTVILEYDGISDRLVFEAELSLAAIGREGGAPGLIQKEAFAKDSILRNYPLWRLPHRFAEASGPPAAKNGPIDQII
jgi:hypothetical protein